MTTAEFRKAIKTQFPHVKASITTISFMDLARDSRKCLTVTGDRPGDMQTINALAKTAGILRADYSGNLRFYVDEIPTVSGLIDAVEVEATR